MKIHVFKEEFSRICHRTFTTNNLKLKKSKVILRHLFNDTFELLLCFNSVSNYLFDLVSKPNYGAIEAILNLDWAYYIYEFANRKYCGQTLREEMA